MTTPLLNDLSWRNLPTDADLRKLSSEDLVKVLQCLESKKSTPPPPAVLDWVMENTGITNPKAADDALFHATYPARAAYESKLRELMDKAFAKERAGAKNESFYQELSQRQMRVFFSISLGLRTEEEAKWVQARRQHWSKSTRWSVSLDDSDLRTYKDSPQLKAVFEERLAVWNEMLNDIESQLSTLDENTVRARLDEEINKPFNPSPQQIEGTRSQMGSYDSIATMHDARALLESEHQTRLEHMVRWRQWLETTSVTPKRPSP